MQKTYRELVEETKMDGERLRLIVALGNGEDIVYHYHLICEDWAAGERLLLENSFDRHRREGTVFLLEQLRADESSQRYIDTAYLATKTLSQLKHKDFYAVLSKKLITFLLTGPEAKEDVLRRKRIIALGWIGLVAEIDVLVDFLRGDPDALCRAWAAASFVRLSFHVVAAETVREKTRTVFAEAIRRGNDLHATGVMLEATQTLFGKKRISAAAVETAEPKAILKAGESALRFLTRYSAEQID